MATDAVVDVTTWPVVAQEPRGDEEKDWIAPAVEVALTREHWWLFKPIKRGRRTGYRRMDDVAEYVTAGLARLLDLPSAEVHMAVRDGDEGIISRHVAPPDWELESGDAILTDCDGYVYITGSTRGGDRIGHNLDNIARVLDGASGPLGTSTENWTALEVFAGYLLLDAWVANTDRHALNWAILAGPDMRRLAHSFDHGSALASGTPDENLPDAADVERFCERGYAGRFEGGRKLPLTAVYERCAMMAGSRATEWRDRLAGLEAADWGQVLDSTPRVSVVRRTFMSVMLAENRRRLL